MSLTPAQRQQIATHCRLDAWQRARALLTALHVPAGAGPLTVVDWLLDARPTVRTEAQRVLLALQRQRWAVQAVPRTGVLGSSVGSLAGPASTGTPAGARAGLLIRAGQTTWWLRFATQPVLQVQAIERFADTAAGVAGVASNRSRS